MKVFTQQKSSAFTGLLCYIPRCPQDCLSFGNKSMLSRIPMEQAWLVLIYTISVKHELGSTDYRLWQNGLTILQRLCETSLLW